MGGAFVGLADDAMAVYYNPAGLRFLTGSEIHLNNATWAAGLSYQFMGYGFRHSALPGTFGLSWTVLQMSPFLEKTEEDGTIMTVNADSHADETTVIEIGNEITIT